MRLSRFLHEGKLYRGEKLTAIDCERCGYIHLSPFPKEEEVRARYETAQFYAEDKPNYRADEERDKEWLERVCYPTQMALAKNALTTNGNTLLDVGAGYGHFVSWAADRRWSCKGLEPSSIVPAIGAWKFSSIEDAEIDCEYDMIRAAWVLEHLLDPRAALKKMRGWLKPSGVLLVIVPNDFSLIQQAVSAPNNSHNIEPNYWLHPTHINYWSYGSLSRLLAETGFAVVSKFGTFPMEQFLLQGTRYLDNEATGAAVHEQRKQMELELVKSDAGREVLSRIGFAMAEVELGRDMIFVARREK